MSTDAPLDRPLDRRFLIRGGAVLAGAAGVTAIGAAIAPTKADAADGDSVTLGEANDATSTTSIRIDGTDGGADAALTLQNANGPSLALQPLDEDWDGPLEVGEIANTDGRPEHRRRLRRRRGHHLPGHRGGPGQHVPDPGRSGCWTPGPRASRALRSSAVQRSAVRLGRPAQGRRATSTSPSPAPRTSP